MKESSLFEDVLWGVEHDAFEGKLGENLLHAYRLGVCDELLAGLIRSRIHPLKTRAAFGELSPFRKPRLTQGELLWGYDQDGDEIRCRVQQLTCGVLDLGNTGSGKSTRIGFSALGLANLGCPVWLFDNYKRQFRQLLPEFRKRGQNLIILQPQDWKFNLLQADCCDARTHLNKVIDLLVRACDLPPRARSILNQACHDLYRQFGIWTGQYNEWPNLFDGYEWIWRRSDLNAAAREALLDRLGSLLLSLTPRCAAYRRGWNVLDLAAHSVAFEMQRATETVKHVFAGSLLFPLFQHEIEKGVVNSPLNLVVICDDSQRFTDESQQNGDMLPLDEMAGVIRGTGRGLWISAQTTQGLSRRLVPNLATKILGRFGSHEDLERLGADMGLNTQQKDWARLHLKPGVFIGQFAEGDWREPFVFTVPLLKLASTVTDQDATESVRVLDSVHTIAATEYLNWQPNHVSIVPSAAQVQILSDAELRLLQAVIQEPGKASSHYAQATAISGKRFAEIRISLVQAGYLREHQLATGQRGRAAIVLEPLPPAFEATRQL